MYLVKADCDTTNLTILNWKERCNPISFGSQAHDQVLCVHHGHCVLRLETIHLCIAIITRSSAVLQPRYPKYGMTDHACMLTSSYTIGMFFSRWLKDLVAVFLKKFQI